jgi:hypothetical protein
LGVGLASEGRWRPMTWYSFRRPAKLSVSLHAAHDFPAGLEIAMVLRR